MLKQKDDTDLALRRFFFLLLFIILALVTFPDHENIHLSPAKRVAISHTTADISRNDAIPGRMVSYDASQKYFASDLKNSILFPPSLRNWISDFDRKIARNFIYTRITAFSARPFFGDLYLNLPHNRNDIPGLG